MTNFALNFAAVQEGSGAGGLRPNKWRTHPSIHPPIHHHKNSPLGSLKNSVKIVTGKNPGKFAREKFREKSSLKNSAKIIYLSPEGGIAASSKRATPPSRRPRSRPCNPDRSNSRKIFPFWDFHSIETISSPVSPPCFLPFSRNYT